MAASRSNPRLDRKLTKKKGSPEAPLDRLDCRPRLPDGDAVGRREIERVARLDVERFVPAVHVPHCAVATIDRR